MLNYRILSFLGFKKKAPEFPVHIKDIPDFNPRMEFLSIEHNPFEIYEVRYRKLEEVTYVAPAISLKNGKNSLTIVHNRRNNHTLVDVEWGGWKNFVLDFGIQSKSSVFWLSDSQISSIIKYYRKIFKKYSV